MLNIYSVTITINGGIESFLVQAIFAKTTYFAILNELNRIFDNKFDPITKKTSPITPIDFHVLTTEFTSLSLDYPGCNFVVNIYSNVEVPEEMKYHTAYFNNGSFTVSRGIV